VSEATKTGVWFVRADNGGGSYPVTPEGWRVVWTFTAVTIASAVVSIVLSQLGVPYWWIAAAIGTAASAFWFFRTARRHTDDSMTVSEYKKSNSIVQ
jgi:hypothetical protein